MNEQIPDSEAFRSEKKGLLRKFLPLLFVIAPIIVVAYVTSRSPRGLRPFDLVGLPAPEIVAQSLSDSPAKLVAGRWNVVHFWTTTCTECRAEIPEIRRFAEAKRASADTPVFLNINIQDSQNDVLSFVGQFGVPPIILLDQTGKSARTWGVTGVPETFIVDPSGLIRLHIVGATTADTLDRSFDELLQKPSSNVR